MDYIVLSNVAESGGVLFRGGSGVKVNISSAEPRFRAKPKVELASFDKQSQIADVLRDPRTGSVARNMPLKLTAPFDVSSP